MTRFLVEGTSSSPSRTKSIDLLYLNISIKEVNMLKKIGKWPKRVFSQLRRSTRRLTILIAQIKWQILKRMPAPLRKKLLATSLFMRTLSRNPIVQSVFGVIIIASITGGYYFYHQNALYKMTDSENTLLSSVSVSKHLIKEEANKFTYNHKDEQKGKKEQTLVLANPADSTGKVPYKVELPKDGSKGITFSDSEDKYSITITPTFDTSEGRLSDGHVIYPSTPSERHAYTFKRNGIKEDIILSKSPEQGAKSFTWELNTGELEAKDMGNGSIGLYSANPMLFGDISVGDDKSQELLDNAKQNGDKTNLVFILPAPYITDSKGTVTYDTTKYVLEGSTLTLEATDLQNINEDSYPISIDPTVVVTTNQDFATGSDSGMISYPGAGNIARGDISAGAVGGMTANSTSFTTARTGHDTVAYNGFLYILGGFTDPDVSGCDANGNCNDIQYCPINTDGSVGSCTQQLTAFTTPRSGHSAIAYNKYIYILGGFASASATGCDANGRCNDIQYCPINTDGSVGSCTQQLTAFTTPRAASTATLSKGFLYIAGGQAAASATGCDANGRCNDIQYCPINASGSVGTCTQQLTAFTTPRDNHASAIYNGFLYITGGTAASSATGCNASGWCNDIQYCPINASGSVGTCTQQLTAFTTPRTFHTSVAYNGYIYIIGGMAIPSATGCDVNGYCNDIQYCPINASGSVGTCTQQLTALRRVRISHASAIYNGFLYNTGGQSSVASPTCISEGWCKDIEFGRILMPSTGGGGIVGATTQQASAFGTARYGHTSVAYNGYLYIIGGSSNGSDILRATINSNGSLSCPTGFTCTTGVFTVQSAAFTNARYLHTSVVYNGYLYIAGGWNVTTDFDDVQYCPINSNGSVGACTQQAAAFVNGRRGPNSVAYNGYLYIIGGLGGGYYNDILRATINSNGSLSCPSGFVCTVGVFTQQAAAFTTARYQHDSVVYNGYLYIIGGTNGTDRNDVQYCLIASTGVVGACTQQTTAFVNIRYGLKAVVSNGYMYISGGRTSAGTYYDDILFATIGSSGSLSCPTGFTCSVGVFTQQSAAFTTARYSHSSVAYNNYIYIIGGNNGSNHNDVQYLPLSPGTPSFGSLPAGAWSSGSALNNARMDLKGVAYNGYLYIVGGLDSVNGYMNTVEYASINTNGSIGTWTINATTFTTGRFAHTTVIYNGFIYVMAGTQGNPADTDCGNVSSTTCNDVQYAPVNANGSVGTWQTDTNAYISGERARHTSVAYNGYIYVIGGSTSITDPYREDIQYALICTGSNNGVGGCGSTAGEIGTWNTNATPLTVGGRYDHASFAYNGYMYVMGGIHETTDTTCNTASSTVCSDILYAPISTTNGSVGSWTSSTNRMSTGRYGFYATAYNGYVYMAGGRLATGGTYDADVHYWPINANGSMGTIVITTQDLTTPRAYNWGILSNGYMYVIGGTDSGGSSFGSVEYKQVSSPTRRASYERVIDITKIAGSIDSVVVNGQAVCGYNMSYSTAGSDGLYGSTTNVLSVLPGLTYTINSNLKRYLKITVGLDDSYCGTQSYISDLTLTYTPTIPAAPTLITQADNATGLGLTPSFTFRTTDVGGDYLRYKIDICTNSDCSSLVSGYPKDQNTLQTGWSGQDTQTSTAYVGSDTLSSSTIATYTVQSNLSYNTQYWWRAYAKDPGDSDTFSSASSIYTFYTNYSPVAPTLSAPASGATNVSLTPEFRMYSTDPNSDYVRYKVYVYQSNCSSLVTSYDQPVGTPQTGWSGQSTQSGTAYTSGQTGIYTVQSALTANTTYCWKASAKDAGGTNLESSLSSGILFTTTATTPKQEINIGGTTTIHGGTTIGN